MSASKQARLLGLKSLTQVINISTFPRSTLEDMNRRHPQKFKTVCLGVIAQLNEDLAKRMNPV
jgi:hypothetical protein